MKLYRTTDELEISGSVAELAEIYKSLNGVTENYSETFIFETIGSPEPYDFLEKQLKISTNSEATCVTFNQIEGVVIKGNINSLKVLASFFDFDTDANVGDHNHWDNCCDSKYTAESTLPIVISVE